MTTSEIKSLISWERDIIQMTVRKWGDTHLDDMPKDIREMHMRSMRRRSILRTMLKAS